jgi:hypothetical protein
MAVDWHDCLSLTAEGDRSYLIASVCRLCGDGADE